MRAPKWFRVSLAEQGGRVVERAITDQQATERVTDQILAKDRPFASAIIGDYVRKQLRTWTGQHSLGLYVAGDAGGQLDLFPEIPRRLETAPGRFADQAVMTRKDWDAALRQAQTKANNASGFADAIRQVYDKVRPLLTSDDLTTADVWRTGGEHGAVGGGQ